MSQRPPMPPEGNPTVRTLWLGMRFDVPFPFPDERFPPDLGAVVQRTVLDGRRPVRCVAHTRDDGWLVGDDVEDPNVEGACVAVHMRHIVDQDPSVEALATLPVGFQARRVSPSDEWEITPFAYLRD